MDNLYLQNLDKLSSKKTKAEEKLAILDAISQQCVLSADTKRYEFKMQMIMYLISAVGDKNIEVFNQANNILSDIVTSINPFLIKSVVGELLNGLHQDVSGKVKSAVLKILMKLTDSPYFKESVLQIIEPLSLTLHDYSKDVSADAEKLFKKIITIVDNKDIFPIADSLIDGLTDHTHLADTIDSLVSTVFVQSVDAQTLCVIVPVLTMAFAERTNKIVRQTIVIIENMTKLVENERDSLYFINKLLPLIESAQMQASEPAIRAIAEKVHKKLEQIKEKGESLQFELNEHISHIKSVLPSELSLFDEEVLHTMYSTNNITKENLVNYLNFDEFTTDIVFKEFNSVVDEDTTNDTDNEAEELCNILFTLGYGSKVLLHQTKLHLKRGFKYGLIGTNGSGKTTLMRAIATQQLESFPSHLKSVFVETDILGDLSHLSLLEYIKSDPKIALLNFSDERITQSLSEIGFTEEMIFKNSVSTLSGGWRMKLALIRALMQDADILLMDEPTAHLDVINLKWLLEYIKNLVNVTCIIVSQNAKLLNDCCTHIMQVRGFKLYTAKGNLSDYLVKNPDASSYFELKSDKYTFSFPQPRFLEGIRSKGKALMRMENITFSYTKPDGTLTNPIIKNASVQVSLSSRIGCLGPNGAGKSTAIKILTGQLEPQRGTVTVHPGTKVGYIAQHAFAHISNHLEKTPNEYIQWRYSTGEDKEDLHKANMQMSQQEIDALVTEILVELEPEQKKVKRIIRRLTGGRRPGSREREYEVEIDGLSHDHNQWLYESDLIKRGYEKILKVVNTKCDAANNLYKMALTRENIENHLEKVGMIKESISHVKIKHLSNGDKVKVVIGAALWMLPHILILDEPTNNIDRDGLAALSDAIRGFEGGIIVITHDEQFCHNVCQEIWVIEDAILNIKGDPDWMKNIVGEKIEKTTEQTEMVDAQGNVIKIKAKKGVLTRKEKMAREKRHKMLKELGEAISSDDDDLE